MKKISKILSVLLALCMVVSCVTGCSSKKTMFDIMKEAGSFESYSYKIRAQVESDSFGSSDLTATISGEVAEDGMSMGFRFRYSSFSFEVEEFAVVTKDAVYLNIGQLPIESLLSLFIGNSATEKLSAIKFGWVEIPLVEGMAQVTTPTQMVDMMVDFLKDVLADTEIVEDKGVYTFKVDSISQLSELAGNAISAVGANKEAIANMLTSADISEETVSAAIELYLEKILSALVRFSNDNGISLTDDDIASMRAQIDETLKELDFSELANAKTEMLNQIDELVASKDEVVSEIASYAGLYSIDAEFSKSLTGKKGAMVYSSQTECEFKDSSSSVEEVTHIKLESEVTQKKGIKTVIPESYMSFEDLVYNILTIGAEISSDMGGYYEEETTENYDFNESQSHQGGESVGTVVLESMDGKSVTLYYDADNLYVDYDISTPEWGDVWFVSYDDEYTALHFNYYPDWDYDEYREYATSYYYEDDLFDDVYITDDYEIENYSGITYRMFEVYYTTKGSYEYEDTLYFYSIVLDDGQLICGNTAGCTVDSDSLQDFFDLLNTAVTGISVN